MEKKIFFWKRKITILVKTSISAAPLFLSVSLFLSKYIYTLDKPITGSLFLARFPANV